MSHSGQFELYRNFIDQVPNAIAMFDTEMRYLATSRKWLTDYNLPHTDLIGKSHYEVFPEIGVGWKAIHQKCLEGAVHKCDEAMLKRSNGNVQWLKWDIRPWYQSDGLVGGIIMFTTDITKQKLMEEQLNIEREQFSQAFETAAIGMAIIKTDGTWLKVNDSLVKMLGYSREELYQKTFADITHPEDLQADLDFVGKLLDGVMDSYQMEKRYYRADGGLMWATLSVSVVRTAEGVPLHFISQISDITERKKMSHLRVMETDKHSHRIAFELHENIAQTIASIKIYLNSSLAARTYHDRDLNSVDRQLSALLKQIKLLSESITPTTFLLEKLGFVVNNLVEKYSVQHKMNVNVDINGALMELGLNYSYHIFRIIEDHLKLAVLRNADSINISSSEDGTLIFDIVNKTENADNLTPDQELLLSNIKTRVEMMEGSVKTQLHDNSFKTVASLSVS